MTTRSRTVCKKSAICFQEEHCPVSGPGRMQDRMRGDERGAETEDLVSIHKRRPTQLGDRRNFQQTIELLFSSRTTQIRDPLLKGKDPQFSQILHSPGAASAGAPPITSAVLNTGFDPKWAGLAASNCS